MLPQDSDDQSEADVRKGDGEATASDDTIRRSPLWFEYLVVSGCSAVLSFGGIGLALAVVGHYSAALAFVLGAPGTALCVLLGRPRPAKPSAPPQRVDLPALGMCAVAGALAVWNSVDIAHHVVVDSDPGVYAVTGKWLSEHQSLVVQAGLPWSKTGLDLNYGSAGIYPRPGATVEFQFAHLFPVLLAEAHTIGGDALMFRAPVILGALALCSVYLVGCRVIQRPWVVLAVVTALGVSLPELSVTRDTYSEPVSQILLWCAIWLLLRGYEERRFGVSLLAGLAIGSTLMAHIDAPAYLAPLPVLAALAWLAAQSAAERRSLLQMYATILLGLLAPAALGTLDLQRRAGHYYQDLHSHVASLYSVLLITTAVAVVAVIAGPSVMRALPVLAARRNQIAAGAAWVVGAGLVVAWSLRPAGPKATGSASNPTVLALQQAESLPLAGTRSYAEQTMRWIEWYIGPVTLALAIAGLCYLTVRVIGRGSVPSVVLLAMAGPLTAIYLWTPSITPDQIWAMRRYVPASLPLFVLAAGVMIDVTASVLSSRLPGSRWSRRALIASTVSVIAFPLGASLTVGNFQPQANYLPLIDKTCKTIGTNAAVLFPYGDEDASGLMQTIRSWCDIPVAELAGAVTQQDLQIAASALRATGKTLWVLSGTSSGITGLLPDASPQWIGTAISRRQIQLTLTTPASNYSAAELPIYGAKVVS